MQLRGDHVGASGLAYADFKRSLTPRYGLVWLQIAGAYVLLAGGFGLLLALRPAGWIALPAILGGAVWFGYWMAYLVLYLHEAAHFNIAGHRGWNDLLANVFIGAWIGQHVTHYRHVHFRHHRDLGTRTDSEISYFHSLDLRFLLATLTGWHVRGTLAAWKIARRDARLGPSLVPAAVLLHLGLVAFSLWAGAWWLALAWALGVASFFPLFTALRQLLEHRAPDARAGIDYRAVDQGAVSRMFADGLIGNTLGGAGMNRHLLHHLDPQISCTRLRELDGFLMTTPLGPQIDAVRSTYLRTAVELWGK